MAKTYILDTSIIVADPHCLKSFADDEVVLPIAALDELDKLKKFPNEAGKNARIFIRLLDAISDMGDVGVGVLIENNVVVKIDTNTYDGSGFGERLYGDTHILACAYHLSKKGDAVLLTNDINLRIRGRARGIVCHSHTGKKTSTSELYAGIQYIENVKLGEKLNHDKVLVLAKSGIKLNPNECVVFCDKHGIEISKGRAGRDGKLKLIEKIYPWNLTPRNSEQEILIDLIMDPKISLVTVAGHAGTGKSIVSIGAALELVIHKKVYSKMSLLKSVTVVGDEIGFLPGSMEDKLGPVFAATRDSFEVLFSSSGKPNTDWKRDIEMFQKKGRIELDAITYIRGRSIPNSIILVDECQNLNIKDVKTIITRAGEGSKIVLLGDIEQIDNKDLDADSNGLTTVIEKFKDWEHAAHITLIKGERSVLASKAATLL